jgi:hypothetical protein
MEVADLEHLSDDGDALGLPGRSLFSEREVCLRVAPRRLLPSLFEFGWASRRTAFPGKRGFGLPTGASPAGREKAGDPNVRQLEPGSRVAARS